MQELREKQSKLSQEAAQGRPSAESEESKKKKAGKRIQIQEVNDSSDEDSVRTLGQLPTRDLLLGL